MTGALGGYLSPETPPGHKYRAFVRCIKPRIKPRVLTLRASIPAPRSRAADRRNTTDEQPTPRKTAYAACARLGDSRPAGGACQLAAGGVLLKTSCMGGVGKNRASLAVGKSHASVAAGTENSVQFIRSFTLDVTQCFLYRHNCSMHLHCAAPAGRARNLDTLGGFIMAQKPFSLGNTQQHLHTNNKGATISVWAAADINNFNVFSHVKIYLNNEGGCSSATIDLSCEQLEMLAGDCMRIMAYRRQLEAKAIEAQNAKDTAQANKCMACALKRADDPFDCGQVCGWREPHGWDTDTTPNAGEGA